jgi:hypothetical protein
MTISVVAQNDSSWTADLQITGLNPSAKYDLVRVIAGVPDTERKYSVVGWRRDWQPASGSVFIRDYQAPLRPYQIALYDSSQQTPVDWLFQTGPYAGPAPVQVSPLITIQRDSECGAILRSAIQPEFYVRARISGSGNVQYPARAAEHAIIGAKYPVFVVDRREGRRTNNLTFYTRDAQESEFMRQLLLPDTGRIYPLWLRTADDDAVLFGDMYFMPLDIEVEPVAKLNPQRKFWRLSVVEIDPRSILPRNYPDAADRSSLPNANFTWTPRTSTANPHRIEFTDTSTGTYTERKWNFALGTSKYGTGTQPVEVVDYSKKGARYTVRLTVKGIGGTDSVEKKIVVP